MRTVRGMACGMISCMLLVGCGTTATTVEPTPVAVLEATANPQEPPTINPQEPLTVAPAEPTPSPVDEATPEALVPTEAVPEPSVPPEVPSNTPELPSNTPIEAIATLVAVQFGTFPQEANANGDTVAWNQNVRTSDMPNAGFFVSNAPEGVELQSLDCRIIFDGKAVYERIAPSSDLTLFGQQNAQGDFVTSYTFAEQNFVWPDFDGDGTSEPIVSGDYTLVLRGETNAGTTVEQSIPFTIDLEAASSETPTPAP